MVKGSKLTDKQYFQVELDSASSLKAFAEDRKRYYRRYIQKENIRLDQEESQAIKIGDLVDCLLLNEEEFDKKFYMTTCSSPPTGKMLDFVNALLKHTKNNTGEDGQITVEFKDLMQSAYDDSDFKHSIETVVKNFVDQDPERYYNEKRLSTGKTIVTSLDLHNAKKIVDELKTNEFTYEIFRKSENKLTQLVIEDFELFGLKMKCKMDLVTINHEDKTIQIDDVKITWSVEKFKTEYYLYRKAYIQAYVYYKAMESYKSVLGLGDYKVLYPRFIVADSINYYKPLIYTLSDKHLEDAEKGFDNYIGVKQIITELRWAKENNIWNISMNNYLNKGEVKL